MDISDYKATMKAHGPCAGGEAAFAGCRTRKDVFELIGGPEAVDFFLGSIKEGWGPSPEDFETVFRPYINGALTVTSRIGDRKVRSQIWCRADDVQVDDSVRWLILLGCRGFVRIKEWQTVKIFLDRNTRVRIECAPNSIVYVENYGGEIGSIEGHCRIVKK